MLLFNQLSDLLTHGFQHFFLFRKEECRLHLLKELLLGLKLHRALFFNIRLKVEVGVAGLCILVLGSPWAVTEIQLYAFDGAGRCCHGGWWIQTLIAL